MINFSNILSSIGVVAGNLNADNKYDFYYGIEWSDGSFTYNEYEFYEKSGFDSQYDFFQNYADSEYDFYRDIDSPGVSDQYSFFKNGGQFFNLSPVASFTTSSYNKVDDTFSFTNTSANADTYSWDFGDGNTSTQTNPTHTYVTAGDYTVELTASEGGLNPSTHTLVVEVYDYNVEFTSVNNQLEVTFTNTTTATNITIDQYDWDFGDGNTSTDTNPTHTYAADGTYTVNLITYFSIDGDTISGGTNKQVSVSNIPNVTSLTTTDIQTDQFTYSFDPEPTMDGYNVEYKEVGGTVSNNNNSLTVTGLTPTTDYEYRVQWYLGVDNGSWSSWIPVTTSAPPERSSTYDAQMMRMLDGSSPSSQFNYTFGGWFQMDDKGGLMSKSDVQLSADINGQVLLHAYDGSYYRSCQIPGVFNYGDGSWHFIVGVMRGNYQTGLLYVDDGPADVMNGGVSMSSNSGDLSIGRAYITGGYFTGKCYNAFWYDKQLSSSEISALYNNGSGLNYSELTAAQKTSLTSWYDMNEVSGTRYDSHGSYNLNSFNNVGSSTDKP